MAILVDEGKLRDIFEEIYEIGWGHGFINQALLNPDAIFLPFLEKCKKSP